MRAPTRRILVTRGELSKHSQSLVLFPRLWDTFAKRAPGLRLRWEEVPFRRASQARIPQAAGVYAFVIRRHVAEHPDHVYLMYIGSTDNLRRRFGDYLRERVSGESREDVIWLLNTYARTLWFTFSTVVDGSFAELEEKLYTAIWPPINRKGKTIPGMLERAGRAF